MSADCALSSTKGDTCLKVVEDKVLKDVIETTIEAFKKKSGCETDECVLERAVKDNDTRYAISATVFKVPTTSFDHNYWMNNTEIDSVMFQLRCHFPGFAHSFIHMIDLKSFPPSNKKLFDYPVLSIPEIDFAKEFKQQKQLSTYKDAPLHSFGVVCNTDSSKGSGQHWFSVFISTDNRDPDDPSKKWIRIELFNSAGGKPRNAEFNKFWEKTALEIARETGCKCTYDEITNIQHQSSDTGNCGSYSLFYIYARLNKANASDFNRPHKIVSDKKMKEFREVCFRIDERPTDLF